MVRYQQHVGKAKMCLISAHYKVFENCKDLSPFKLILALPTWGQKCTLSIIMPFTFVILQTVHPVGIMLYKNIICIEI